MARSFVTVEIHGQGLAIEACHIEEVVGPRARATFGEAGRGIIGAMPWRGSAIAVLDIGALTGLAPAIQHQEVRNRNPIGKHGGLLAALPVDVVREAVEVSDAEIAAAEVAPFCREQLVRAGATLPVFDLPAALLSCRPVRRT